MLRELDERFFNTGSSDGEMRMWFAGVAECSQANFHSALARFLAVMEAY